MDLVLTPYDVLRLKNELRLRSDAFLARYVILEQEAPGTFPRLYLAMVDDGRASCPFVCAEGCRVYGSRPAACRAYPVGRAASINATRRKHVFHVLLQEEHCLGFRSAEKQTVDHYADEQGLLPYNELNDATMAILLHNQVQKGKRFSREQLEKFMLALYNLDDFRKVVQADEILAGRFAAAETDRDPVSTDTALLRFGIRWLEEELFGE